MNFTYNDFNYFLTKIISRFSFTNLTNNVSIEYRVMYIEHNSGIVRYQINYGIDPAHVHLVDWTYQHLLVRGVRPIGKPAARRKSGEWQVREGFLIEIRGRTRGGRADVYEGRPQYTDRKVGEERLLTEIRSRRVRADEPHLSWRLSTMITNPSSTSWSLNKQWQTFTIRLTVVKLTDN